MGEQADNRERVVERYNGDLVVTDSLGRRAELHWSRFHGLMVTTPEKGTVYLGQPEVGEWLKRYLD